ncbi:tricarballylate utilization 4Fe-4S protein TcuB [Brevibacillus marinus]|uniref:tricarballylate utilization 4Fe-4S protein TcuB n=1 Tax=Brevibacillus marinus TaxID=2496837 RepID=UPI000F82C159|nr:tricarballylate utilization 4Fe-4S protein TcuB [Brevibacillus marinus]
MKLNELFDDGKRQMRLCNACRYCEGYCAVWRAIEWRRDFTPHDMAYLANLCHDCRECYFACPFIPPHEFAINPPKLFSGLRDQLYQKYAWPAPLARAVGGKLSGVWTVVILTIAFTVVLALASHTEAIWQRHVGPGAFYRVMSESAMIGLFGFLGLWMLFGWLIGAVRFWRDIKSPTSEKVTFQDVRAAISYAMSLRYLGGEGAGCKEPSSQMSSKRRLFHHLIFYGFLLDFASTSLAAFYAHVLKVQAPYPLYHPVVILGALGGIGLIIGICGFLYVKSRSNPSLADERAAESGNAFAVSLLIVAVTGMLLLAVRDTAAMGITLLIHLGSVAALFFIAPYSKFVHFVYRFIALVRYAQEDRVHAQPAREDKTKKQPIGTHSVTVSK